MGLCTEKQVSKYLNRLGIPFTINYHGCVIPPNWGEQMADKYRVSIGKWSYDFYQGLGIKEDPTPASVLYCLILDRTIQDYSLQDYLNEFDGREEDELTVKEQRDLEHMLDTIRDNSDQLEWTFNATQLKTLERLLEDY